MRDGLVVDFNDAVGNAAGKRRTGLGGNFDDPGIITVDAQLSRAGEHTVTLHALDDFFSYRHVHRDNARQAVRCAADDHLLAISAGLHAGLHVVGSCDRLDRINTRQTCVVQVDAHFLNPLALGRFHGNEGFEFSGRSIEPFDVFAQPVVRKFQSMTYFTAKTQRGREGPVAFLRYN